MADKSQAGWDIVEEHLTDNLASDSDDEKRIRQAEARALKKKKTQVETYKQSNISRQGVAQCTQVIVP